MLKEVEVKILYYFQHVKMMDKRTLELHMKGGLPKWLVVLKVREISRPIEGNSNVGSLR